MITCCTQQGPQLPFVLQRANNHVVLKQIVTARCNLGRMVFTTNSNEVVTYKFFTSTIPRKAFLGIPFIWFSLRSLNKGREKKCIVLTKRTHFSNLNKGTYTSLARRRFWICYTTRCSQLSPPEVCGMSWNDSPTKPTRIRDTNDRTSRKQEKLVVMTLAQCHESLAEDLQPNLMLWNCNPVVEM